jgi:hypothetical protein
LHTRAPAELLKIHRRTVRLRGGTRVAPVRALGEW